MEDHRRQTFRSSLASRVGLPEPRFRARVRRNHGRPPPNGFTGRARNSASPFTAERERASGKALTFVDLDVGEPLAEIGTIHPRVRESGLRV
jgi:hypothetical protein